MMRTTSLLALLVALVSTSEAFVPQSIQSSGVAQATSTQLAFGIPGFLTPKSDDDEEETTASSTKEEKKIGLSGIVQLITAGAGAPFLGDFEGVDEETGKFMFSLEANNLVDDEGNSKQTQMPYFESGCTLSMVGLRQGIYE